MYRMVDTFDIKKSHTNLLWQLDHFIFCQNLKTPLQRTGIQLVEVNDFLDSILEQVCINLKSYLYTD